MAAVTAPARPAAAGRAARPSLARAALLCAVEARPVVQLVFALRFVLGVLYAGGPAALLRTSALTGLVGWVAAVFACYLLNGVTDRAEDLANGSTRPIAAGALPVAAARRGVALLAAVALAAGVLTPRLLPCLLGVLVLGLLYSCPPVAAKNRSLPCTLVVIATGLLTYLAGGVAAGGLPGRAALVTETALALWMGLVGAVCKDLSDVPGDTLAGRRTLAVVRGEHVARRVTAVCALSIGIGATAVAPAAPAALAGPGVLALGAFLVAWRCRRPGALRGPYRAFMVTQYTAHLVSAAAVVAG